MDKLLRRRAKKHLPKRDRAEHYIPALPDTVWTEDFISDALITDNLFRTLNVTDDFNRDVLHIENITSITIEPLVRAFEQHWNEQGLPQVLRTDNWPEFIVDMPPP
jgi:putative transposase